MCTKEDMTELQRACLLLKKGWEIQKHSVRIFDLAVLSLTNLKCR